MRVEDGGGSTAVAHSEAPEPSEVLSTSSSSSNPQSAPLAAHDDGGIQSTASRVDSSDDVAAVQTSQPDEQEQMQDEVRLARTRAALSAGPKPPEATITNTAAGIVIDAGDGDDQISIDQDTSSGDVTVSVNGEDHKFTGGDRTRLTDWRDVDPVVVLYHEMSHTYNIVNGSLQNGQYGVPDPRGRDARDIGLNNLERQAVGLNNDGIAFDFDNDPGTPATTANPHALTENGLRDEMGRDQRPSYSVAP